MTFAGDEPPTEQAVDVHALARLSVNDNGEAEWATGPK
jgi:hypothetical protein